MPPAGEGEGAQTSLSSQFSSIYPKEKTAIAVVDLDQKRVRKRKGNDSENPPPPSKKAVRVPKGKVQSQASSASYMAAPIITMVTAVPSVIVATSESTPPQSQPHPPPQTSVTNLAIPAVETAGGATSPSTPQGLGVAKGAKRMKGMKLQVAKQPVNPLSLPSSNGQASVAAVTSSMLAPPTAPPPADRAVLPAGAHQGGDGEEQDEDMAEGSGLLADTIRQVDRTFKARMDLLTGQPGDLGFKYFTEKVSVCCPHTCSILLTSV